MAFFKQKASRLHSAFRIRNSSFRIQNQQLSAIIRECYHPSNFLMRKLQTGLILGTGVWCLAILLPAFTSAEWIRLFFAPICHQIPERSFWLFGKPLAVCARCSGFYFGFLFGQALYSIFRFPAHSGALRTILMIVLVDVANSFLSLYPDLALSRFSSAFMFSVVVTPFVVQGLYEAARSLRQTEVQIP